MHPNCSQYARVKNPRNPYIVAALYTDPKRGTRSKASETDETSPITTRAAFAGACGPTGAVPHERSSR